MCCQVVQTNWCLRNRGWRITDGVATRVATATQPEEQIIGVLKQVEAGRTVKEVARELGVSEATIYTWKSKYGGMEVSEARRLKELEDENRRLKHMVANLSLDKEALKAVIRKNGWSLKVCADRTRALPIRTILFTTEQ